MKKSPQKQDNTHFSELLIIKSVSETPALHDPVLQLELESRELSVLHFWEGIQRNLQDEFSIERSVDEINNIWIRNRDRYLKYRIDNPDTTPPVEEFKYFHALRFLDKYYFDIPNEALIQPCVLEPLPNTPPVEYRSSEESAESTSEVTSVVEKLRNCCPRIFSSCRNYEQSSVDETSSLLHVGDEQAENQDSNHN